MKKQILIGAVALMSLAACSSTKTGPCPGSNITRKDASVYFAFNSDELTPVSKATLREVAAEMKQCPYRKAIVTGYTDSVGAPVYNFNLGDRRAASVKDFLLQEGIPSYQVQVKSMGEQDPAACNTTAMGRAEDRRAVIQFE